MLKRCKITVLKLTFNKELADEYGVEGLGACPFHKEGQEFHTYYYRPDGFCDEAWKSIYQFVFALAHGAGEDGGLFYHDDWIKEPGVAICCCNDGIRPVLFKVERVAESPPA
jgi:uncharacterized repeat protein (TIGR04076 family)